MAGCHPIVFFAMLIPFAVVPLGMLALMRCGDLLRRNFRNQAVITSGGVAIYASFALQLAIACIAIIHLASLCSLIALVAGWFLFVGLIDDIFGDRVWRGLSGHIRALLHQRRITTGLIKAIGGILGTAVVVLWHSGQIAKPPLESLFGIALICLSANGINLLDKRPSRALKVFWVLCGCSFALADSSGRCIVAMLAASTLPYAFYDFTCRAMLGDAGANMLGAALGSFIWAATPLKFQLVVLALLVALHVYAEKRSLTEAIASSKVLSWFDRIGVR
ncbi:MAG: hypothetical protein RMK18_01135 [Armatimonadota bacterium]|nr:hypothetical protein [Armatimonadota bacterium]MCX7776855.1 hypothetical protein [Armatimonadota bacterium]MDW8024459.1 hypothetical protein [Armatimonadota bacterium]